MAWQNSNEFCIRNGDLRSLFAVHPHGMLGWIAGAGAHTLQKALGCFARRFEPIVLMNEDPIKEIDSEQEL